MPVPIITLSAISAAISIIRSVSIKIYPYKINDKRSIGLQIFKTSFEFFLDYFFGRLCHIVCCTHRRICRSDNRHQMVSISMIYLDEKQIIKIIVIGYIMIIIRNCYIPSDSKLLLEEDHLQSVLVILVVANS